MVFTASHSGHYMGGVSVVVASSEEEAREMIVAELALQGIKQDPNKITLSKVNTRKKGVDVLFNGDY